MVAVSIITIKKNAPVVGTGATFRTGGDDARTGNAILLFAVHLAITTVPRYIILLLYSIPSNKVPTILAL